MCECECLTGDPIGGDPRNYYQHEWQTGLCESACRAPCCFVGTLLFPCLAAYCVRVKVLDGNMQYYKCCQGYHDGACWTAGSLGESYCPRCCNALEALLCFGCHVSASRTLVMDTRSIRPDPCDNRLVAFSDTLALIACICDILSIFCEGLECIAHALDHAAIVVLKLVASCMLTQTYMEVISAPRPIIWSQANAFPRSASRAGAKMRSGAAQESLQAVLVPKQCRMDD